jgi:hypothetical protein
MEELSTQNNLVRFLYQETSLREEIVLKRQMASDTSLQEDYAMLKEAKQRFPKVLFNPSSSVLDRIMNHSRTTATEHFC